MKSDCPHCGRQLARRLVLARPVAGQRRLLPMRAIAVCPLCRRDLATNVHPLERRVTSLLGVPLIVAVALFTTFPGVVTGTLFGGAVIGCVAGAVYLQVKTRDWQRYKRPAPEP